jgi:DNA-binding IclR family transcriptional regulator
MERLFQELIGDKLIISQMMALLREHPLSSGELSEALGLSPSQVSVYLNSSARQGLVRFDESQKRFALA